MGLLWPNFFKSLTFWFLNPSNSESVHRSKSILPISSQYIRWRNYESFVSTEMRGRESPKTREDLFPVSELGRNEQRMTSTRTQTRTKIEDFKQNIGLKPQKIKTWFLFRFFVKTCFCPSLLLPWICTYILFSTIQLKNLEIKFSFPFVL